MPDEKKPKCPECGIELEGNPETCAKCGLQLSDYRSFFRFFKTAAKQLQDEEAAAAAEKKDKAPKKLSTMDYLRGKRG